MDAEQGDAPQNVCMLCRVTVLPAAKRICIRCWRMMRSEQRREIAAANGGRIPEWVDRGHD